MIGSNHGHQEEREVFGINKRISCARFVVGLMYCSVATLLRRCDHAVQIHQALVAQCSFDVTIHFLAADQVDFQS